MRAASLDVAVSRGNRCYCFFSLDARHLCLDSRRDISIDGAHGRSVCMPACACMCVCACMWVCACMHACMRVCVGGVCVGVGVGV